MTKKKQHKEDRPQSSLYDFGNLTDDEKRQFEASIRNISHENHIADSQRLKDDNQDNTFDFIDFDEELKKNGADSQNLRSEQIYINDPYYNKIFSILCRYSKNLFNSSIYEIRQVKKVISTKMRMVHSQHLNKKN